ncbi:hypothetical protein D3C80_1953700 [compost metagenome]
MRGVSTESTSGCEVVIKRLAIIRVHTIIDDDARPLPRRQAAQVSQADFGDKDVDVMLGVVYVADHRHYA